MDNTTAHNSTHEPGSNIDAHNVITIIYIVLGALGILGNSLVFTVMACNQQLRNKMTNKFIMNQSLLDFIASFLLIFTALYRDHMAAPKGLYRKLFCIIWTSIYPLFAFLISSSYNLVFLTIEKYCAILHPEVHRKIFTKVGTAVCLIAVWFIGPLWDSYSVATSTLDEKDKCSVWTEWPSKDSQMIVGIFTFIVQWLIPIVTFIFCYSRIAIFIKKESTKPMVSTQQDRMRQAKLNIIKTLITVSVVFFICWTPNQIHFLAYQCRAHLPEWADFTSHLFHITVILIYLNCMVNPVIYSFQYHDFQQGLSRLFRRGQKGNSPETGTDFNNATEMTLNTITMQDSNYANVEHK